MIFGDYHTHTTFSHGKHTVAQNVCAAEKLGLKEIAITDHGMRHMFHAVKKKHLKNMRTEIDAAAQERPSVKVLMGIEANIISSDGSIDLKPDELHQFDIILCGYHVAVWGKNLREQIGYLAKNQAATIFKHYSKSLIKQNTRAYVEMIKKYPVSIITHINFRTCADVIEVARVARDYGTFIELSGKRTGCTDEQILDMANTGVQFILDSDAHTEGRVGDVKFALDIIDRLNIPYSQIANWDKQPEFRKI